MVWSQLGRHQHTFISQNQVKITCSLSSCLLYLFFNEKKEQKIPQELQSGYSEQPLEK